MPLNQAADMIGLARAAMSARGVKVSGIFRFIVGVVFGLLCAFSLSPAVAAFHNDGSNFTVITTLVIVAAITVLATFAPNIRRALGRGFLALGACLLFLPISALALSGRAASDVVSVASSGDQAAATVGAGLAGAAITGAATFIGLILGGICVIIGLVLALGGRREVIIVERAKP